MGRFYTDDDPLDRPEFFDREIAEREQELMENIEDLDSTANEKHDLSEIF